LNILFFLMFALSIGVQYNDPDPWVWVAIYGYGAVVTLLAIFNVYTPLAVLGAVGYLLGFLYWVPIGDPENNLWFKPEFKMSNPQDEVVREAQQS